MIAIVKELVCDGHSCNTTLHFDVALSNQQCLQIAQDRYGWSLNLPEPGMAICNKKS